MSLPIMRVAKVDSPLRRLLMAQLVQQTVEEGDSVVLPEAVRVQRVTPKAYAQYRDMLGGLTNENELKVRVKLQELGIIPGAGTNAS
jgi:hypothetical protein